MAQQWLVRSEKGCFILSKVFFIIIIPGLIVIVHFQLSVLLEDLRCQEMEENCK